MVAVGNAVNVSSGVDEGVQVNVGVLVWLGVSLGSGEKAVWQPATSSHTIATAFKQ